MVTDGSLAGRLHLLNAPDVVPRQSRLRRVDNETDCLHAATLASEELSVLGDSTRKRIMEKVVYLLGAGFSAPLGLPVMSKLPLKIQGYVL